MRSLLDQIKNNKMIYGLGWDADKKAIIGLFVALCTTVALGFIRNGSTGHLINKLTDVAGKNEFAMGLVGAVAIMALAFALPSFVNAAQEYWEKKLRLIVIEKADMTFIEKRASLDAARHEDPAFQDLINKASERGTGPIMSMLSYQVGIVSSLLRFFIASAIIISLDMRLFLPVLLSIVPLAIARFKFSHDVWSIYDANAETRRRFYDLKNRFNRRTSLIEMQLFQNEKHFLGLVKELLSDFNAKHKINESKKFRSELLTGLIASGTMLAVVISSVFSVVYGTMQVGTWMFLIMSLYGLQEAGLYFFSMLAKQHEDSQFVTSISDVMETQPVIEKPKDGIMVCSTRIPKIVFENVSFSYPGQKKLILERFNLTIHPGETIALVGVNGAGKTTLMKLLCHIYDPCEGRITIDGVDLRLINTESWWRVLGILSQDFSQYHFAVKEVIALGRTDHNLNYSNVLKAAKMSGSSEFIEEWGNQYNEMIGKEFGGIDPSKGQNQKLAIARALYRDPLFIVLDEPTASIDAEAEMEIFEHVHGLNRKRSTILISHRFNTVRKADKICVLKDGTIVELGGHNELMEQNGDYARLFRLQAAGYQD